MERKYKYSIHLVEAIHSFIIVEILETLVAKWGKRHFKTAPLSVVRTPYLSASTLHNPTYFMTIQVTRMEQDCGERNGIVT